MRVAIPLSAGAFSPHFGQSTGFWICDVAHDPPAVTNDRELALPDGGGCQGIPPVLAEAGVSLVIAGGMGQGAVEKLARHGIEVVTGVAGGSPRQIAEDFAAGRLVSTGARCDHHSGQHRHQHSHGHGHGGGCHHGEH